MCDPFHLKITSDPDRLAEVRVEVERIGREVGFAEDVVAQMVLAVDEALTNVIRHGYEDRPGLPIELVFDPAFGSERPGLEIRIRDYGRQTDPGQICGRELDDVRPGGLGVHLIETAMDEVEYSQPDGGGMEIRLRKYLRGETN